LSRKEEKVKALIGVMLNEKEIEREKRRVAISSNASTVVAGVTTSV